MTLPYKLLAGLLVAIALFAGGYFLGKGDKEVQTVEKVVEKAGETQVVYRDHIITVVKTVYPDGTTTETTKTEDKSGNKDTKTVENDKDKSTVVTPSLPQYSLGLFSVKDTTTAWFDKQNYKPGISAGYRVWNPVWLKFSYVPSEKLAMIGFDIQW